MKRAAAFFIILILFLTTGCLPVEEEVLPAPALSIPEAEVYNVIAAEIGDVVLYKDLRAVLVHAREEILTFPMNGILFDIAHVSVGDYVETGDILIELDRKAFIRELEQITRELEMAELRLKQLEEMFAFERRRASILGYTADTLSYYRSHDEITGWIDITKIRIRNIEEELERRVLRATMDGYVTYLHRFSQGDVTVADVRMAVIADVTETVFLVTEEEALTLNYGDEVELKIQREMYPGVVINPKEFNISENRSENEVFIQIHDGYEYGFTTSTSGILRVVIQTAKDVLSIPHSSLNTYNGRYFVFVVEDGLRVLRYIEVGLIGNTFVEITGGLQYGDLVILG